MASTDADWGLYAGHRARLTEAILGSVSASAPGPARLCILGAGKCNDVELDRLAGAFAEIHLVDLDAASLGAAVARQPPAVRARLRPHALVDLSGIGKRLARWKRRPPAEAQIEESASATLRSVIARLPGPFEVVVSACVLTQMSFAVRDALGERHPALDLVRFSVVAAHLNTLIGLTAAGGASLFVTDLVSSNLFPLEEALGDPRTAMERIAASGVAYRSANPALVRSVLADENLATLTGEAELLEPWIWAARERAYFVYALRIPRLA